MADSNFHWRWRRSRLGCFALTEGRGDLTSGRARAVQAEQGKGDLGRPFGARWRFPQGEHSLVTGPAAFRGGASPVSTERAPERKVNSKSRLSELRQLLHRAEQVAGLGQDGILEKRLIGDEGIRGCDSFHRGIEMMEQFVGDAGGDFGAVSPA